MKNKLFIMAMMALGSFAWALDANEIVKKADQKRIIEQDNSFIVEITDLAGQDNQKTKYKIYSKGTQMSRVETVFPERQIGRKLLMKGDDLWLFTPDVKRPTRVSMQQKLTGEVANGDIARTNFGEDYNAKLEGEEQIEGQLAYRLDLKKKRDEITYSSITYWVSKSGLVPLKANFKTENGKDLKTAIYSDLKKSLGKDLITKIEITNALNKNQKSVLRFLNYKKESLDESFFNKESLSN